MTIAAVRNTVFVGITLTSTAYFLFSGQDAAIKLLVEHLPVWQIMFFRSVGILLGCMVIGRPAVLAEAARSPVVVPMMGRSLLMLTAWLCFYSAAKYMQLAELTTVYFAAPVIVTILSIIILGERVPLSRWAAVLIGFIGVFVACNPAELGFSWPIILVLAAAFLWATSIVLLRKIALHERTILQIVMNNAFFLIISGIPTFFVWQTPSASDWVLAAALGLLGGTAQVALYEGMKRADASTIASFEYMALIWAFVLGYLIWGDIPRPGVFAGAALIMSAGVIILVSERRRAAN